MLTKIIYVADAKIQKVEGSLTIDNITPQDGGNYTCTVASSNTEGNKNVEHQLLVISMPTYAVQARVMYNLNEKCELSDVDLSSLYMPSNLKQVLCGFENKICNIQVHQPHCVVKVSWVHGLFFIFGARKKIKCVCLIFWILHQNNNWGPCWWYINIISFFNETLCRVI